MIKRFFLLSIFSLAFVSAVFSNEVKNENVETEKIVQESEKELIEKEQSFEDVKNMFSNIDSKLYKDFPWEFMAKKFNDELIDRFDDVELKKTNWGFVVGYFLCAYVVDCFKGNLLKGDDIGLGVKLVIGLPLFVLELSLFFSCLSELFDPSFSDVMSYVNKRDYNVLKDFLDNWSENKNMTPEELHKFFDNLCELNKNNSLVKGEDMTKLVESIRNLALRKSKVRVV